MDEHEDEQDEPNDSECAVLRIPLVRIDGEPAVEDLPGMVDECREFARFIFCEQLAKRDGDMNWVTLLCTAEIYSILAQAFRAESRAKAPQHFGIMANVSKFARRFAIPATIGAMLHQAWLILT